MTLRQVASKINGWSKVIAVFFACGVLWAKVEQLRDDVAELKRNLATYTTESRATMSIHESRISNIEGRLYTFFKGVQ